MPPAATDSPKASNVYTRELARERDLRAAERLGEQAAAVVLNAAAGSFASLRPRRTTEVDARAVRLLAESATRRLLRWADPANDGLDPADRDGLLRQADVLGLPADLAEKVLLGVEARWRDRPRGAVDVAKSSRRASRRRIMRWGVAVLAGLMGGLLVLTQIELLRLWGLVLR